MNSSKTIPATKNEAWGFWGTMDENAEAAWPIAVTAISEATGTTLESVGIFLDSSHGRHFADDVRNQMHAGHGVEQAVHEAVALWMSWRISRVTSRNYGIPQGLPYLTGFMIHCEIGEEIAA